MTAGLFRKGAGAQKWSQPCTGSDVVHSAVRSDIFTAADDTGRKFSNSEEWESKSPTPKRTTSVVNKIYLK